MNDLSLHILDIAQNSVKASATLVEIRLTKTEGELRIEVIDNGCGMDEEFLKTVTDPFTTTRTTRKVGLGIPLFKMNAELTGGFFEIQSEKGKGTHITAVFKTDSIDLLPLGDMAETMTSLVAMNPTLDFVYAFNQNRLDTREMKEIMGELPINSPDVLNFIKEYIKNMEECPNEES